MDAAKTMRELCGEHPALESFLQSKGFPFTVDNPITELVTLEDVAAMQALDLPVFIEEFKEYAHVCSGN